MNMNSRILTWITALLIMVTMCSHPISAAESIPAKGPGMVIGRKTQGLGWVEFRQGIRVLHLQGTPYDMGYQHGKLMKNELMQIVQLMHAPNQTGGTWPGRVWDFLSGLYQKAFVLSRIKRELPSAVMEEMRGMVAGSEGAINLDTLLIMQFLFEGLRPGGSSFVALSAATQQGTVLHGYNMEGSWPAKLWDLVTVIIYEPLESEKFVSIGWPGMVGVIQGLNHAGLSLTYHSVLPDEGPTPPAIPGMILAREALQHAKRIDEVLSTFRDWPRSGGSAITVADAANQAMVLEYNQQRISYRLPERGLLQTTNFYATPALLPLSRGVRALGDGRFERLKELLLKSYTQLSPTVAVSILRDRYNSASTQESLHEYSIANSQTTTSVVFDPIQRFFWVAKTTIDAPAPFNRYVAFNLRKELGEAVTTQPSDIPASFWLGTLQGVGMSLFRMAYYTFILDETLPDRWSRATTILEQAVAASWSAESLYWLGVAYAHTDRLQEAIQVFGQAAYHPKTHSYWRKRSLVYLGHLYESMDKEQAAASAYQQALNTTVPYGLYSIDVEALDAEAQTYIGLPRLDK